MPSQLASVDLPLSTQHRFFCSLYSFVPAFFLNVLCLLIIPFVVIVYFYFCLLIYYMHASGTLWSNCRNGVRPPCIWSWISDRGAVNSTIINHKQMMHINKNQILFWHDAMRCLFPLLHFFFCFSHVLVW